jgi:hypothetical protein
MQEETGDEGQAGAAEVVGRFAERASFLAAIAALIEAGFERSDLSVLDSHESLSASEEPDDAWRQTVAGLVGEAKYLGPMTAAGLIMLASGPVGAALAGAMGAGLAGAALYELLEDIRATPHTRQFARALERGAVLLWVPAPDPERTRAAAEILARFGAVDIHTHRRTTD